MLSRNTEETHSKDQVTSESVCELSPSQLKVPQALASATVQLVIHAGPSHKAALARSWLVSASACSILAASHCLSEVWMQADEHHAAPQAPDPPYF